MQIWISKILIRNWSSRVAKNIPQGSVHVGLADFKQLLIILISQGVMLEAIRIM